MQVWAIIGDWWFPAGLVVATLAGFISAEAVPCCFDRRRRSAEPATGSSGGSTRASCVPPLPAATGGGPNQLELAVKLGPPAVRFEPRHRRRHEAQTPEQHQLSQLFRRQQQLEAELCQARRLVQQQQAQLARSWHEARTDSLSKLLNRRGFDETLDRLLEQRQLGDRPLAVLIVDVDHFKGINDAHGHLIGDRVLGWVSRQLTELVRPTDYVARLGGDEFAVLLDGAQLAQAKHVAARMIQHFQRHGFSLGRFRPSLRTTLSIGLAVAEPADTAEQLIQKADTALYRSKRSGRNRVHWVAGLGLVQQ